MPTLCNHASLSFQAWEAADLEEDRGPQQVEIFILGIEGGGSREGKRGQ